MSETIDEHDPIVSSVDDPTGYAWSKATDEVVAGWVNRSGNVETVVGRFGNVYGPEASFDPIRSTVIHGLISRMVDAPEGGTVTVWGDGKLNLNTAPYEVLAAIPRVDEEVLEAIVAYRNGSDGELGTGDDRIFKTLGQVGKKLDVSAEKLAVLQTYCKTDGFVFTVEALATRRQGKINAFCDVTVSIQTGEVRILQWRENPIGT